MPKYRVTGADAETGAESPLMVEAPNAPAAREIANSKGMLVASVEPLDTPVVAKRATRRQRTARLPAFPLDPVAGFREIPVHRLTAEQLTIAIGWGIVRGWVYLLAVHLVILVACAFGVALFMVLASAE